jgi:hypothetical protein
MPLIIDPPLTVFASEQSILDWLAELEGFAERFTADYDQKVIAAERQRALDWLQAAKARSHNRSDESATNRSTQDRRS